MTRNVLPYNTAIENMSLGCIASSALSSVVLFHALATFAVFRNRVDCCFNRFIVIFCALQLLQCIQKIAFAAVTILNGGLPFVACDVNASLDQFLDFTSLCFLIAFFVGMSNTRRFWDSGWNRVAYITAPLLGLISLATLWVLLADRVAGVTYDDAPYFTQDLAWCWIPNKPDGDLVIIKSVHTLRAMQMFVGYAPTALVIGSALYAYLAQKCRTGESWLGKGVILRRFLGVSIFPVLIYVIGLPIRISFAANANTIAILISTVYPLTGSMIGFVFLWTEGGLAWIPRLVWRKLTCRGGRGSGRVEDADAHPGAPRSLPLDGDAPDERGKTPSDVGHDRRFSDLISDSLMDTNVRRSFVSDVVSFAPSSPKRSGLSGTQDSWLHSEEAVPSSFTATLRTMMCDAVVGQHVASSRGAMYSAHYGRIVSDDRRSIADSAATTESAFERTTGGYGDEGLQYQIVVNPASRRSVKGPNDGYDDNDRHDDSSRNASLQELRSQQRLSDGPHLGTPNTRLQATQYTTRSARSSQYMAPQVRVRDSSEAPSSLMLLSYSNRSSAQRLQSSPHLREGSATAFPQDGPSSGVQRTIVDASGGLHPPHEVDEQEVQSAME
jgi:hypothetical protein